MNESYLFWNDANACSKIKKTLSQNEVVLGSSDTVFGLLANTTEAGFEGLDKVKKRERKPYIVLVGNIDKLKHFVAEELTGDVLRLLNFCWPGPLTMIFNAKSELPDFVKSEDGKVALRIPQHDGLLKVLADFNGLFSTSANLSGEKVPGFIENINPLIVGQVSEIVLDQYSTGYAKTSKPSTILDCSGSTIKIIRAGAYSIDSLNRICDNPLQG